MENTHFPITLGPLGPWFRVLKNNLIWFGNLSRSMVVYICHPGSSHKKRTTLWLLQIHIYCNYTLKLLLKIKNGTHHPLYHNVIYPTQKSGLCPIYIYWAMAKRRWKGQNSVILTLRETHCSHYTPLLQ